MPVDTASKRFSIMNLSSPWRGLLVVPDAAIDQGDRQAALTYYSGLAFAGAAVTYSLVGPRPLRIRSQQGSFDYYA